MGKRTWSKDQEEYLEKLYSDFLPLEEIVQKINQYSGINRAPSSVSCKAVKLGLTKKYIKPNNPKFKAVYQDYDWYYYHFVDLGLNHDEMANIAQCTKRVIEKWGEEKHHIDTYTRMKNKKLNQNQYDLIIGSLLGDGHIDKRDEYPLFIVSHAEDQKDYLYYKYKLMEDLCEMTPTKYNGKVQYKIGNCICDCQDFYRFNTRTYDALREFRYMSKIDIMHHLNSFSLSVWFLDDGHCDEKGYWELCAPFSSNSERYAMKQILKEKFNIHAIEQKDNKYFRFHAEDSCKITNMILSNIPNDLDIIKNKILSKKKYYNLGSV